MHAGNTLVDIVHADAAEELGNRLTQKSGCAGSNAISSYMEPCRTWARECQLRASLHETALDSLSALAGSLDSTSFFTMDSCAMIVHLSGVTG
jgi:hypothetical protein